MDQVTPFPETERSLIEIGVIVAGRLDHVDERAAKLAVEQADQRLTKMFPRFRFDFFEVRRPEILTQTGAAGRVEPSLLLHQAVEERDAKHWDFAFVLTSAELVGNYLPYCFAALSRPLDAAVISLSLIDPVALGVEVDESERVERIARRLSRLILHGLGHMCGLGRSDHPNDLLFHPPNASALDYMEGMEEEDRLRQERVLEEVADQRLEEGGGRKLSAPAFMVRAMWINRYEILRSVWAASPWVLPRHLSRLTIASFSTLAILFMTAEAWDLALAQSTFRYCVFIPLILLATTIYVVARQQLLIRRGLRQSEQAVVTSFSAIAIVFIGMASMWLTLAAVGLVLSWIFPSSLIASWAASSELSPAKVDLIDRMGMSIFAASVGLAIGSLGASFESQYYFRHIIFVDEEL